MITATTISKNSFEIIEMKKSNTKESEKLITEACQFTKTAKEELDNGVDAMFLLMEHKRLELRKIADWHFRQCLEILASARKNFVEVLETLNNPKRHEYCRHKINEVDELYLKANNFLEKVSKKSRKTVIGRG